MNMFFVTIFLLSIQTEKEQSIKQCNYVFVNKYFIFVKLVHASYSIFKNIFLQQIGVEIIRKKINKIVTKI